MISLKSAIDMPKNPNLKTKYESNDPNFKASTAGTKQVTRKIPTRQSNKSNNSSSSEDDYQSPIKESHPSLITETHTMAISQEQLEQILQRVLIATAEGRSNAGTYKSDVELLQVNNYQFWSKAIKASLKLMNLWLDPSKNPDQMTQDEKKINEKAANYLLTRIDSFNMSQITSENDACFVTIWNTLKQFHEPDNPMQLIDFYSNIYKIIHKPNEDVRLHLIKLDAQFETLLNIDQKLPEEHKVAIMLASVRDSEEFSELFQAARWQKKALLTVKSVRDSIIAAYDSKKSNNRYTYTQPSAAHAVNKTFRKHNTRVPRDPQKGWGCPDCRMDNHTTENCFKKNKKRRQGLTFSKVSNSVEHEEPQQIAANVATNHISKRQRPISPTQSSIKERLGPKVSSDPSPYHEIYPRPSYDEDFIDLNVLEICNSDSMDSGINKLSSQNFNNHSNVLQTEKLKSENHYLPNYELNKNFICMSSFVNQTEEKNKTIMNSKTSFWLIDSGASLTICNDSKILQNYSEKEGNFVTISDGSKIKIQGFGMMSFEVTDIKNTKHVFKFEKVAFIPSLSINLISVKDLIDMKLSVYFSHKSCTVKYNDIEIILANQRNNVFSTKIKHTAIFDQTNQCIHDLHKKMSHRNLKQIKRASENLKLKIKKCNCSDQCIDCIKAKLAEPTFPQISDKPFKPLMLITSDLCGPFQVQSIGGAKYFITFTDVATDYTEVYTLKLKSDALEIIKRFMEKCKVIFGTYPMKYRADRGGEFTANELQNFLSSKGISLEYTVPQTPQQNGISERKNRTLVESIRTILSAKNLPQRLWAEALHYSNDTFNAIPKIGKAKSPKENFFNQKFEHRFEEFGHPVIYNIIESNRSKLLSKGEEGIFVGLDHESKGFHIYSKDRILIRRNVKFLEISKSNPNSETSANKTKIETKRRSERLKTKQENFLNSTQIEPKTFKQAMKSDQKDKWEEAMKSEILSITNHKTWEVVNLPRDRTPIGSKWVFKIKTDSFGNKIYKARLVAQGFTQKYGQDYDEVFAPVVRSTSFRVLLTIAGRQNMTIMQFDVKTAFLNGNLDSEIYMKPPKGIEISDKVFKLKRSLYGLKQAARIWNHTMNECLQKLNFVQSKYDSCLYVNKTNITPCYLIVHVDDMLIASKDTKFINEIASRISNSFELKSLGEVQQFVGINVKRDINGTYIINQSNYIQKIAETFRLEDAKLSPYPMDLGYFKIESDLLPNTNTQYRKIIGMLLYVSTNTRPDISAAIGILSQRLSKPRKIDLNESYRVVKYLLKTSNHSLVLGDKNSEVLLTAFSDANWGENREDRKSSSGFLCQVFGGTVSWLSKRQRVVATSTTESEYYALAETVKEIKWLKGLLSDFDLHSNIPIKISTDSQPCMKMITNEKFSNETKHIDVRYHFTKEEVLNGTIQLVYIPSELNLADMLTKPLSGTKIRALREMANLKEIKDSIQLKFD